MPIVDRLSCDVSPRRPTALRCGRWSCRWSGRNEPLCRGLSQKQAVARLARNAVRSRSRLPITVETGAVRWDPTQGQVDSSGYWLVEIEYDLDGDGMRVVTAPTNGYWPMRLIEDLGDAP